MTKRHPWQHEIDLATAICAPLECEVAISNHAYEIATVKGSFVSLIIYPHTVKGTRNQHARVRDNGSKNKAAAREVMTALYTGQELPQPEADRVRYSCTFSWKNMTPLAALSRAHRGGLEQ